VRPFEMTACWADTVVSGSSRSSSSEPSGILSPRPICRVWWKITTTSSVGWATGASPRPAMITAGTRPMSAGARRST
jgi:hypothetical protein